MILRFRRRHVQRPRDPLAVWFLDQILRVVAHRENRWFGRCYFTISDLQENIPRTKSRHMSWPTFVNILKHPPLRASKLQRMNVALIAWRPGIFELFEWRNPV